MYRMLLSSSFTSVIGLAKLRQVDLVVPEAPPDAVLLRLRQGPNHADEAVREGPREGVRRQWRAARGWVAEPAGGLGMHSMVFNASSAPITSRRAKAAVEN